jgi:beta-galactosidase
VELPVGPNVSEDRKFASRYRFLWQVPYHAGTLKVVAYRNGKSVASDQMRTAGPATKVVLVPDHKAILADGDDLSFVTVRIEDKDGNVVPEADNLVHFTVTGPGLIAAVDNGNAATVEPFHADQRKAFNGLALLIVRSRSGQTGLIQVTAKSETLAEGKTEISAQPLPPHPSHGQSSAFIGKQE